jgi:hypothetical protein
MNNPGLIHERKIHLKGPELHQLQVGDKIYNLTTLFRFKILKFL